MDQICFQGTFVIWSQFFGTSSAKPQWICPSTPTTMLTSNFTKYISTKNYCHEKLQWPTSIYSTNIFQFARCKVPTALSMKFSVFGDTAPSWLVNSYKCFGGIPCLWDLRNYTSWHGSNIPENLNLPLHCFLVVRPKYFLNQNLNFHHTYHSEKWETGYQIMKCN